MSQSRALKVKIYKVQIENPLLWRSFEIIVTPNQRKESKYTKYDEWIVCSNTRLVTYFLINMIISYLNYFLKKDQFYIIRIVPMRSGFFCRSKLITIFRKWSTRVWGRMLNSSNWYTRTHHPYFIGLFIFHRYNGWNVYIRKAK